MKPRLRHRLRALGEGLGMNRELDAEVRFHIDMETEKYIRQGMDPVDARSRAFRNCGPMEKHKEDARDARGVSWFEHLGQDLKYGIRTLMKNPGFATLAMLTLGLGIGANTAIFSVINGVLFAGGAFGLIFAWSTIDMLTTFVGRFTERTQQIAIDPGVLGFTLLIAIGTGLVFGTFPAMAARVNPAAALKSGGKGTSDAGGRRHIQSGLIVAQVAVSVVLLVGAGLMLLSCYRLQNVDTGYKADRVMSAEVFGNFTTYPNAQALRDLYTRVLDRLEHSPGVVSAAVTNGVPLAGLVPGQTRFQIHGQTYDGPDARPSVDVRVASPKYFDTLGIALLRGRAFTELDHEKAPNVGIINETMARHWEGRDPVGSEVSFDNGQSWGTIVGIVRDVKAFGLDREPIAQLYRPLRQAGGIAGRVLVRMNGDASAAATIIRDAVHSIDRDLPIENVRTLDEIRERYLAAPKLTAVLLTVFAALALLVTLTGITGVIAQSVSQRTQEFGLRMALGATQHSVLRMVLGQGLTLVALGLVIGIGGALAFARVLKAYLYNTTPTDPLAFAIVGTAFVVAGVLACLGPAWRATTVDPMLALRAE